MFNTSAKLDRMLTKCIRSIEEKGWTIDDCLRQYAPYSTELEPMLRTAMHLRLAREFNPSTSFRNNAQSRMHKRLQSSRRSPKIGGMSQASEISRGSTIHPARIRLAGSLIPLLLISLIIITTGGGIAYAADHAKPGDALFQVDRAIEQLRIRFERDMQQAVRLHLQFAGERIEEAVKLINGENSKDLAYALTEYKLQITAISPLITKALRAGEDISFLVLEISETIITHENKLRDLIQTAPVELKEVFLTTISDVEQIRKVVLSPGSIEEPVVETTPNAMANELVIPTEKSPTPPPPTVHPTSIPPSATAPTETLPPPSVVDLIAENLLLEPETPKVNMVLKIAGDIRNLGTQSASTFGVIFCVDSTVDACYQDQEGDIGIYHDIESLPPGASTPVHTYSWLPDVAGEHIVHICADIGNTVVESDESAASNCTSKIFTVLDSGLIPDLTITALDWQIEAFEDDEVVFSYNLTNEGTGTAGWGYLIQLFVDDQLVPNLGTQIGTYEGDTLMPGDAQSRGFVWRAKCGIHQVIAKTDSNDYLSESDEDNNSTLLHTITVYCYTD
jgi:hypothetical protein